jgi:histidyl-tRNA synthetase
MFPDVLKRLEDHLELLILLHTFFRDRLGLSSVSLELNYLGSAADREQYKQALRGYIEGKDSAPRAILERKDTNILRCFDLKDEASIAFMHDAPSILDYLSAESMEDWKKLKNLLEDSYIPFTINPRLVRGLDYYNKTVFEFSSDALGSQSALCGGGRYDTLAQEFGYAKPLPSLGAGIGIERLLLVLEAEKKISSTPVTSVVIVPLEETNNALALLYAQLLRTHGLSCEAVYDITSVKSMMRKADKRGSPIVVLLGSDERNGNYLTVKRMVTGESCRVASSDIVHFCKKLVEL